MNEPTDNQEIERAEILVRPHFRVGIANDPQPENPYFSVEADAIERAQKMANAQGFSVPIGVWDECDNLLWVFIAGEQFKRV